MKKMDVMDVRAEKAFLNLLGKDFLTFLEPGNEEGIRLYRSVPNLNTASLSRDEKLILFHARWPESSDTIIRRVSAKLRISNQVRWSAERISGYMGGASVIPLRQQ